MEYIGIDIGSTCAKVVVLDEDENILHQSVQPTGWSSVDTADIIKNMLLEKGICPDAGKVVATGYGRVSVPYADKTVTEITCHARGAVWLHKKKDMTVIDIGGPDVKISSMCTVFAESEVISLIGQGEKKENIAFAVVNSIADKVVSQCSKMNVGTGEVFLTGGLCECGYLQEILEQKLGSPVLTGPECRYAGAIGAALCGRNI